MMETNRRCQPAKPFLGVHFVLFGFDSFSEPKIRFKLMDGGGVEAGQYSPSCTHVIVDNVVYDDPICVAAQKDRKALVTALWVDHSYDNGKAVEFSSIMYRPPKDLNGIPGAKGLVICLTGYQRLDRDDIMTLVGLMGAQFSKPLVANKVTHLICYKFEGEKYDLGKRLPQIKLVNHRWLEDCLREWEILPEENYNMSSYELEMMDAQAKDSEDEAEEVNHKECVEKSPLKPDAFGVRNSPKLRAETPKAKYSANAGRTIINADQMSGQTSGFANSSSPKVAAPNGLAQNHYHSPLQKHAMNDLIPGSHLDGKIKEALFLSPDRVNEPGCSNYFDLAQKEKGARCSERETAYSPGNKGWTGSYGTPYLLKKESDMKPPSFRSSPSSCDRIPVVKTTLIDGLRENSASRDAIGCGNSLTEGDNNARQSSCFTKKLEPELLSRNTALESPSKRLKVSSASRVSGLSNAEIGNFSYSGDQKSDSSSLSLAGIGNAVTKTYKKNIAAAKKTLGSRLLSASKSKPQEEKSAVTDKDAMKEAETLDDETETPDEQAEPAMKNLFGEENNPAFDLAKEFDFSNEKDLETEGMSNAVTAGTSETAVKQSRNCLKRKKVQQKESSLMESEHSLEVGERRDEIKEVKESEKEKSVVTSPARSKNRRPSKKSHEEEKENDEVEVSEKEKKAETDPVSARSKNKKPVKSKSDKSHEEEKVNNEVKVSEVSEKKTKAELGPASAKLKNKKLSKNKSDKSHGKEKENNEVEVSEKEKKADSTHVSAEPKIPKPSKNKSKKSHKEEKENNEVEVSEKEKKEESVTAFAKSKNPKPSMKKLKKSHEEEKEKNEAEVSEKETKADSGPAKSKKPKPSKTKSKKSQDEEKENKPIHNAENENKNRLQGKQDVKSDTSPVTDEQRSGGTVVDLQRTEPALFIVSGHRFQRKEFQKVIRSLKGRFCRDSHQWSYQATHFIAPDPIRRTEKFFAAAASGRWILKTDYLSASKNAGKFLPEEPYEWHGNALGEDGAISLEAPRKWRLLRERTGHGAFHGLHVVIYGECIAPTLDTLKRAVKSGDGTILATSPPYTRFLDSDIDFAIVSPGMPRLDMWVHEFLKRDIPCVAADYLVEYVCKPGYSLDRHVLFNCHESARRSFARLQARQDEVVAVETAVPKGDDDNDDDDVPCDVCGSRKRGEVMLICGDESGSAGCGIGRHIDCCSPPFKSVPDEDWFCSDCARKGQSSDKSTKKRKLKS